MFSASTRLTNDMNAQTTRTVQATPTTKERRKRPEEKPVENKNKTNKGEKTSRKANENEA